MNAAYQPLPRGAYIRVFQLRREPRTPDGDFTGEFKIINLDEPSEKYIALSYTWDRAPVSKTSYVELFGTGGCRMPLGLSLCQLFDVLIRQRDRESVHLWIDALCINQADLEERALQVSMMGKVYSSAAEVLVWLGKDTVSSRDAFAFMNSVRSHASSEDYWDQLDDLSGLKSVFLVLGRPWFRRVWVIQEVTLNTTVVMMCGDDAVDLETFQHCTNAIWPNLSINIGRPASLGLYSLTRIIGLRDEFHLTGEVQYERLLEAAFFVRATDARDLVFGFQGIGDRSRPIPEPDYKVAVGESTEYTQCVQQLFRATSTALLCHSSCLDSLTLAGVERARPSGFPSWAIYLRYSRVEEPIASADAAGWDAGGPLVTKPTALSSNELRLRVNPLGTVDRIFPVFQAHSRTYQKAIMDELSELWRVLPNISRDSHLDLLALDLVLEADMYAQPAGPEWAGYFREYIDWLQSTHHKSKFKFTSANAKTYHLRIGSSIDDWRAFTTQSGQFGIGPPEVQLGDMISTVPGCRLPIIFRSSDVPGKWVIVSWCYVRGLMKAKGQTESSTQADTEELLLI